MSEDSTRSTQSPPVRIVSVKWPNSPHTMFRICGNYDEAINSHSTALMSVELLTHTHIDRFLTVRF